MMCTLKPAFIEHFIYEKHYTKYLTRLCKPAAALQGTSCCYFHDAIAGKWQSQDLNVCSDRGPQYFCWVWFVGSSDFVFIKEEGYSHKQVGVCVCVCVCVLCVYVCNVVKNTCFQCTLCYLHVCNNLVCFVIQVDGNIQSADNWLCPGRSNFLLTKITRGTNRSILNKTGQNAS